MLFYFDSIGSDKSFGLFKDRNIEGFPSLVKRFLNHNSLSHLYLNSPYSFIRVLSLNVALHKIK